ncbi:MAG: efflux RND transporter permease subunit [Pseudomonadota bacterium]
MPQTLRQRIENSFSSYGGLIYRNHWKTLVLVLAVVAALVSQLPSLTMDTSTEGFLHEDDPTLISYNKFREQFGRDELILLTIESDNVFAPAFLQRLKKLHWELADNTPYLDDITSLINARDTRGSEGELLVEDLLEEWPETPQQLEGIRERALANPVYRNMMLSEDATITTIVIKTDAFESAQATEDILSGFEGDSLDVDPTAAEERIPLSDAQNSEVVKTVSAIADEYRSDDFTIYLAGPPVVSDVLKKAMQENMKKFMGMALLAIALILLLLFRRLSGVLLPMLTVILSLLSTLGLMALVGIPFKLPTQILPSFLLAVGVGASVHLLSIFFNRLQDLHDGKETTESSSHKETAIRYALGHSGLAIVMTSLTTAAGLASFAGAEVAPVSDLGIISAIGILIALFYTLTLIPALLSVLPLKAKSSDSAETRRLRMNKLLIGIADTATTRSRAVLLASAAILIFGLSGAAQVEFSHKPFEWLPESNPARIATDFVDENMRGASVVEVVVDTGERNGFYQPERMQSLAALGDEIAQIDQGELFVGKTLSLADILKEINKALNENRDAFYTIPDDRQLIAQEFLLFENSGSDDLEDFVDSQFSKARFTVKMPWADAILYKDFLDDIKQRFSDSFGDDVTITVTGMNALLSRTMSATIFSMAESYMIAAAVITLMMILLIGNIRIGLVSMIPNLTPIILTLGLMGWIGLPLDLFTMLIGSIAIGLAVDDTIHFMHNYRRYHHQTGDVKEAVRKTLLTTGRAMFVTTVVLSVGFFLYMGANLSNLVNFGLLTGFTIIMALLADFFLAPALMAELHRSHLISDDSDY